MYDYRRMNPEERQRVLQMRRQRGCPLHAPPHWRDIAGLYLITAACYEHRPIFDHPDVLAWLEQEVLGTLTAAALPHVAWVFMPNHYHVLLETKNLDVVSEVLRLLHSRIATTINSRHGTRGRRVWYRFTDRRIRNERHHHATLNYIHYNPVKHGYVNRMEDWLWSSLHEYLRTRGEEWVARTWRMFPIGDYGKGWDWH